MGYAEQYLGAFATLAKESALEAHTAVPLSLQ